MPLQYDTLTILCDGSNWHILSFQYVDTPAAITLTFSAGFGTVTNKAFYYQRSGSRGTRCRVWGTATSGTTTSGEGTITLPTGFTVLTTYYTTNKYAFGGMWRVRTAASSTILYDNGNTAIWSYASAAPTVFIMSRTSTTNVFNNDAVDQILAAGDHFSIDLTFEVNEWAN